jgi:hypothetical protein
VNHSGDLGGLLFDDVMQVHILSMAPPFLSIVCVSFLYETFEAIFLFKTNLILSIEIMLSNQPLILITWKL